MTQLRLQGMQPMVIEESLPSVVVGKADRVLDVPARSADMGPSPGGPQGAVRAFMKREEEGMTIYQPMPWEIWTLAQVAELPVEARATPLACTEFVAGVYCQHPVFADDGVKVLIISPPHGPSLDRQEIARVVKALLHAEPCLWLELLGNVERRTEPGDVLREPSPTAARTPALAGGDVLSNEQQRLEAEGHAELASQLGHYARRWQDYRVPVWRRPG